ncbi:MAG: glycerate kinase [Bacillota bacterium]|nr:glycerate kinase [Bacillota bacterium]
MNETGSKRVVVAPNALKGSLTAPQAAEALAAGWREVFPEAECRLIPVSDGGDGFVEALVAATGGSLRTVEVADPLGRPVASVFGLLGDGRTAVIEMARASGLVLLTEAERDPERTSTYGTGQLIRAALDAGCTQVLVGIGGSATNDGGTGMARALGARFLDSSGKELGGTGGELSAIARIDLSGLDRRLAYTTVRVACDVNNPLTGSEGAAAVYGPQKGADPAMVERLDAGLVNLAAVIRRDTGRDVERLPGAGAAGGLGGGLVAFLGAELVPGIELVIEATRLAEAVAGASVVLTAEGRIDSQTLRGKAPLGVARVARRHRVPVIAFAGSLADEALLVPDHFDALVSIVPGPQSLEEAMAAAGSNVQSAAARAARLVALGQTWR